MESEITNEKQCELFIKFNYEMYRDVSLPSEGSLVTDYY